MANTVYLSSFLGPGNQLLFANGQIAINANLYTYQSGTVIAANTYTDYTGTVLNQNPIKVGSAGFPVNSGGTIVEIWALANTNTKFVITDAANVTYATFDHVPNINDVTLPSTIVSNVANGINIVAFGADPTGANDSTLAIQTAINAASNAKTVIYAPNGTYVITSTLTNSTAPNCLGIVGASNTFTVFSGSGLTANAIYFTDMPNNWQFCNFTLVGPGQNAAVTSSGLSVVLANNFINIGTASNITVKQFPVKGFEFNTLVQSFIYNLQAQFCGQYGFYVQKRPGGQNGGTASVWNGCYALRTLGVGYYFFKMHYSVLNACASDFNYDSYFWEATHDSSMVGCGNESNVYANSASPGRGIVLANSQSITVTSHETFAMPNVASVPVAFINSNFCLVSSLSVLSSVATVNADITLDATSNNNILQGINHGNIDSNHGLVVDSGSNNLQVYGSRMMSESDFVFTGNTANMTLRTLTSTPSTITASTPNSSIAMKASNTGVSHIDLRAGNTQYIDFFSTNNSSEMQIQHVDTSNSIVIQDTVSGNTMVQFYTENSPISAPGKMKVVRGLQIGGQANGSLGTAQLVSGTSTVNTTAVTSSSKIFLSRSTATGTIGVQIAAPASSIVNASSFVINSYSAANTVQAGDNSFIHWWIVDAV